MKNNYALRDLRVLNAHSWQARDPLELLAPHGRRRGRPPRRRAAPRGGGARGLPPRLGFRARAPRGEAWHVRGRVDGAALRVLHPKR